MLLLLLEEALLAIGLRPLLVGIFLSGSRRRHGSGGHGIIAKRVDLSEALRTPTHPLCDGTSKARASLIAAVPGRRSLCHHLGLEGARCLSIPELLTPTSNMEGRRSPGAPHHARVARETGESLWLSRPNARLLHGSRLTSVLEVAVSRLRPNSAAILTAQIEQLRLVSRVARPLEVLQVQVAHVPAALVPQVVARALVVLLVGVEKAARYSLGA